MQTTSNIETIAKEAVRFIRARFQTDEFIPLHVPNISELEKARVNEALTSTFVSTVGEFVNRIEDQICDFAGAKFAIATGTGTSALHTALRIAGVEESSEVITQPLTFVATANAIKYQHAQPVFIDVDTNTLGMSAEALQKFLAEHTDQDSRGCINKGTGRRIAACVPMHSFGFPVEIDRISEICKSFRISLVEDAAESLGSTVQGRHTGTFGDFGIISFNGNKIVTAGGGGAILTNDPAAADRAKHLTTTAKKPHAWEYIHDQVGYNYRMPNLNAALLSAQLQRLPEFLTAKRELATAYRGFFEDLGVPFIWERTGTRANFWLMTIRLKNRQDRDQFLEDTNAMGVMTRPAWKLLNELPMYAGCQADELGNAQKLSDQLVNVPSSAVSI